MTSLQTYLDEVKARCKAVTPGPWKALAGGTPLDPEPDRWAVVTDLKEGVHYCVASIENGRPGDCLATEANNARLIAAARTDIPKLLRMVDQLMSEIDFLCPGYGCTFTEDSPPCNCRVCRERDDRNARLAALLSEEKR